MLKLNQQMCTRYHLVEENIVRTLREYPAHYDLLSVIMICLGGPDIDNYDGILKLLDVLLSAETNAAEKQKILQDDFEIPMTRVLDEEIELSN